VEACNVRNQLIIDCNEAPQSLAIEGDAQPETASGFGTLLKSIINRFRALRARHNWGR